MLREGEDWGLDPLGNWGTFDIDDADDGVDLNQERAHNAANEVGTIAVASGGVGVNWVDPVHDAKGNMTTMPKGWSPASGLTCVYDAWNRLVEVKDGATTVGRYEYDGLGRRAVSGVSSAARAAPPGGVDVWRHYFYNAAWQVLETRVAGTSGAGPEGVAPEVQYVWSERYIDAAVLRDANVSDGSGGNPDGDCEDGDDERLYYTTDANMNVTTLLDDTGAAVERYEYTVYGQATVYNSDWSAEVSWSSSKRNAVRYCGYLWDWESDLHTVRYRVYTALVGRWGQRDPIGYADGATVYEYVRARVTLATDALGLSGSAPALPGFLKMPSLEEVEKMVLACDCDPLVAVWSRKYPITLEIMTRASANTMADERRLSNVEHEIRQVARTIGRLEAVVAVARKQEQWRNQAADACADVAYDCGAAFPTMTPLDPYLVQGYIGACLLEKEFNYLGRKWRETGRDIEGDAKPWKDKRAQLEQERKELVNRITQAKAKAKYYQELSGYLKNTYWPELRRAIDRCYDRKDAGKCCDKDKNAK